MHQGEQDLVEGKINTMMNCNLELFSCHYECLMFNLYTFLIQEPRPHSLYLSF